MLKSNEVASPKSCLNKAKDHEMIFVLLARDAAAPDTIRFWAEQRVAIGKNKRTDEQIVEAFECARIMEEQYVRGIQKDLP